MADQINLDRHLEGLARPQLNSSLLEGAYRDMAQDENRERQATEWCEGLVCDLG